MGKRLRSGYTTGACAAAAAKAAATAILHRRRGKVIDIPLPDGSRASIPVVKVNLSPPSKGLKARACVIKDAGDDPDVTNGAEVCASVVIFTGPSHPTPKSGGRHSRFPILITGGKGVGTVTKRGLPVAVGLPAINPVPKEMIQAAVLEALHSAHLRYSIESVAVTVSVPRGEELAGRTLNARLGIIGGLSILGTTGIVKPVSAEAWTATISSCMDVAQAAQASEVVLSTGRTSEKAMMARLDLPEEAFVMMGDYLEFALKEASIRKFRRVHLAAMWGKLVKAASGSRQTHVRHGALDVDMVCKLLKNCGADEELLGLVSSSNTGREVFDRLLEIGRMDLVRKICRKAQKRAERSTGGGSVSVYLVHHTGKVIAES